MIDFIAIIIAMIIRVIQVIISLIIGIIMTLVIIVMACVEFINDLFTSKINSNNNFSANPKNNFTPPKELISPRNTPVPKEPAPRGNFSRAMNAYKKGDYATALTEFQFFAERGHAGSQYNLGLMYEYGDGVLQDYSQAIEWYKLAAEQEMGEAQYNLGAMHGNGHGVLQNYPEAMRWYKLAAEQGVAEACLNLGLMYGAGKGVEPDSTLALMWLNLAALKGNKSGIMVRDQILESTTPEEIAEAERLTQDWLAHFNS